MNKIQFYKTFRAVLGKDTFNRSNGALGTAEIGGAWTINNGSVSIVSNSAKGGTTNTTNAATLVIPILNYEVSADFTWYTGEVVNLIARCDSSGISNFMRLRYDGTNITITKTISGSSTNLATYSYTWTSGTTHSLKLLCLGNTFTGYLDNTIIVSATDDNATKTKTNAGVGLFDSAAAPASLADNFLVIG